MSRKFALPLLALFSLLVWQGVGSPQGTDDKKAEEIKKWTGFWMTKHDQYTEYWQVAEKDGKWDVKGIFANKEHIAIGTYFGGDPMFNNGVLSFTREWDKKPSTGNYEDSAKITAILNGNNIQYTLKTTAKSINYTMLKLKSDPKVLPQGSEFLGQWKGQHDGLDEVMTIGAVANGVGVQVKWFSFGNLAGQTALAPAKLNPLNGELQFQQILAPSPKKNWQNALVTLKYHTNPPRVHFHWQLQSGASGGRDFHPIPGTGPKVTMPEVVGGDPTPPPAGNATAKDFLGTFSGTVDGYKEIWLIEQSDAGTWSVKGSYYKDDEPVGSMVGKNVAFADGKLTFVQDYTQKPAGVSWFNGATITITPAANGNLSYTYQLGAISGAPRILTKGR